MRSNLIRIAAVVLLSANLLTILHASLFGFTALLWLVILLPFTGSLLITQFNIKKKMHFAEWFVVSSGLGVFLVMFVGLLINVIGLRLNQPVLKTGVLLPIFDILIVGLTLQAKRKGNFNFLPKFKKPKGLKRYYVLIHLPILFPLISIVGAVRLNNGGSNNLVIINAIAIAAYQLYVMLSSKKFSEYAYSFNIGFTALALLLSVSMRSNHIIGFDIHQELQVFSATVHHGLWHPHLFTGTYNACLSLTILPAILGVFSALSNEYVFKFLMQIIFCLVPIAVFVIAKKQLKNSVQYAFMAALFFIVQNQFISQFPALIREQVALLFFALLFVVASSQTLTKPAKKVLLIAFGSGMVVSHYSTTYICLVLLAMTLLLRPLLTKKNKLATREAQSWHLPSLVVAVLMLFTFMWYAETLNSTGGVLQKLTKSFTNFGSYLSLDSRVSFINATLHVTPTVYGTSTLQQINKDRQTQDSYNKEAYAAYTPYATSPTGPNIDSSISKLWLKLFNQIIPALVKIPVIIGVIYLVYQTFRKRLDIETGIFALGSGIIFGLFALIPGFSAEYNLERLYQQLLVIIPSALIFGVMVLVRFRENLVTVVLAAILTIYFCCTFGLANQLAFGISNINFNNDGVNYDRNYRTDGEIFGLDWLDGQYATSPSSVNVDRYSVLAAQAYTGIPYSRFSVGLLPGGIERQNYVYQSRANIHKNLAFDTYGSNVLTYNAPTQFLDNNKNKIFSNGDSVVYR